jgi:phage gpG-like protein
MGLYLNWTIEGELQLSRKLLFLSDRVKDWTPAFEDTASYLLEVFGNAVFETEGAEIGEMWLPLSSWYAVTKQAMHPGAGLLVATGLMKSSFSALLQPNQLQIVNLVDYFKYHQSNQPRHKLPRRAMMALAEEQRTSIVRIFQNYYNLSVAESNVQ